MTNCIYFAIILCQLSFVICHLSKVFDSLKGNKFTLLKAEDKLTDKQKNKLDKIR
ncbi:MAG: hypothetical protein HEQ19_20840 [Gloeotrichia echinulata CP02]